MNPESNLPNFIIIGAAKSGTSSLFNIIGSHPQVFPSRKKEIGFFNNDDNFIKGLTWYADEHFQDAGGYAVRMESTPAYLTWSEKTAPRMKQAYRSRRLKMGAIFRDPVQQAYSHYWQRVRLGHDSLSFEDAIHSEDELLRKNWQTLLSKGSGLYGYYRAGCYASRIKPFLKHFDKGDFFFLLQEDIFPAHFEASMKHLMQFLGIDPSVQLAAEKSNVATLPRSGWITKMYWGLKQTFLKPLYQNGLPLAIRRRFHLFLFPPGAYPPIDPVIEAELRVRYADEVRALEDIIQRDLSHWHGGNRPTSP